MCTVLGVGEAAGEIRAPDMYDMGEDGSLGER